MKGEKIFQRVLNEDYWLKFNYKSRVEFYYLWEKHFTLGGSNSTL